jgi:GGDEF domain-containing protein
MKGTPVVRQTSERVLLIGDAEREVYNALSRAVPGAEVTAVASVFDGIAELGAAGASSFTTVIAAAEPIERRPEAAVRALRDLTGDGRLILFGPATMELLSRKMLQFGCDDYILLPADTEEIQQIFFTPPMRLAGGPEPAGPGAPSASPETTADSQATPSSQPPAAASAPVSRIPLAELFLDAMVEHPQEPLGALLGKLNEALAPDMRLSYQTPANPASPINDDGQVHRVVSHIVRAQHADPAEPAGTLSLLLGNDEPEAPARQFVARVAGLFAKLVTLQDRHSRLQKLAVTDELTGLYNARYFRHFLTRIIEKARQLHFPVTLLLFDIDDFKKYNDQFGHGVGDEILKQTSALMKRCTREHDLVARIGGDEFAVVFWDKEGPRQPLHADHGSPWRPPQTPIQVFKRFQKLIATEEFPVLGHTGKGVLGISAGMAVFPYEAFDVAGLIKEADRRLMQLAKKCGKNTLYIVGSDEPAAP